MTLYSSLLLQSAKFIIMKIYKSESVKDYIVNKYINTVNYGQIEKSHHTDHYSDTGGWKYEVNKTHVHFSSELQCYFAIKITPNNWLIADIEADVQYLLSQDEFNLRFNFGN